MLLTEQSDFKIYLNSYYCFRSYGGMLAGLPDKKYNQRLMDNLPNSLERVMGKCKIHLKEPEIRLKNGVIPYLPHWINVARLHSKAIHSDADGSMLILVWFRNSLPNDLIHDIANELMPINWVETAENFYF